MRLKRVVPATALMVLMSAGIASASTSGAEPGAAPTASGEKVVAEQASTASIAACWTTFNPSAPNGAPMDQTYVNCNTSAIYVASGYNLQGQINLGGQTVCDFVPVGGSITWHWNFTQPGANYTTVICRYPA